MVCVILYVCVCDTHIAQTHLIIKNNTQTCHANSYITYKIIKHIYTQQTYTHTLTLINKYHINEHKPMSHTYT